MTQRHEEQKRERRRAEREKQATKLVPLMPLLVRMQACKQARAWVQRRNFATFAELWDACPKSSWLWWLIAKAIDAKAGREMFWSLPSLYAVDEVEEHFGWLSISGHQPEVMAGLREMYPRAFVERALYDYAVREGLA